MSDLTSPRWSLTALTEAERPLLMRLFEHYLYDFSELAHADVDDDGLFQPPAEPWVRRFWTERGRQAFLLRADGRPAGFTLIEEQSPMAGSADRHFISGFFVMRAYRRRGLGEAMAVAIFDRFPGRWQVLQIRPNTAAQRFWRRVIGAYTSGRFAERWITADEIVQEFDTDDRKRDD